MDILPHTPPPLQPSSASKLTDKTKRKKSTTVRRRRKKVTCSNKDTTENGATTSVGTEEETKKKKKRRRRRLWTKRVRKREPSLSPDSELFDKTFAFNFGIFRSPTKRRPKRQPSPPPSPSVQRSTRRRKKKKHSKKSIAGLHKSSSEPWTDIADGATARPLDTDTGGFEHDFEPNSAPGFEPGFEPDFEPDYDFGRDFGGGYSFGQEHSPLHPDGASQDQAPSSLKRSRIEKNAKKQRNRRRTARAEAKTKASKRPELFQAYLLMKKKAKEVLRQSGFVPSPDDEEWCDACHERRVTRKVRVVDLFFAGMRELRYCPCSSEIQTLAAHGLLPTSSSSNRKREGITAFTFRTIEYLDTYWRVDLFGIYGMSEALVLFWSSELSSEDPFNKGPTVLQHLQAAIDEYQFMQQLQATLTPKFSASPRASFWPTFVPPFGPRIDEAGKSENDLDVIIAVDGNFQHRRFARANADPLKSRPALFLPPDKMRNEQALIDGSTEAGEKDECTANWMNVRVTGRLQTVAWPPVRLM